MHRKGDFDTFKISQLYTTTPADLARQKDDVTIVTKEGQELVIW